MHACQSVLICNVCQDVPNICPQHRCRTPIHNITQPYTSGFKVEECEHSNFTLIEMRDSWAALREFGSHLHKRLLKSVEFRIMMDHAIISWHCLGWARASKCLSVLIDVLRILNAHAQQPDQRA